MPAFLVIRAADGTGISLLDWGKVGPGRVSGTSAFTVTNSGDAATKDSRLTFGAVGNGLLTAWETITVAGVDYRAPNPVPLGAIAAGQSVRFTLRAAVPPNAALSTLPLTSTIIPQWLD